jgi:hypothetical protein
MRIQESEGTSKIVGNASDLGSGNNVTIWGWLRGRATHNAQRTGCRKQKTQHANDAEHGHAAWSGAHTEQAACEATKSERCKYGYSEASGEAEPMGGTRIA